MGDSAVSRIERQSLPAPSALRSSTGIHRRWLRGSIAAGLVAASFTMGWLGHAARPQPAAGQAAITYASEGAHSSFVEVESSPRIRSTAAHQSDERNPPPRNDVARPVMRLRIGTESTNADVPILAGPGIDAEWLRNQPSPVSEHGQVVLEQHGYQVDQRRRLITTVLADGRRVTVPIDQVQIRYTGSNPL
jgi:hypothetical protein